MKENKKHIVWLTFESHGQSFTSLLESLLSKKQIQFSGCEKLLLCSSSSKDMVKLNSLLKRKAVSTVAVQSLFDLNNFASSTTSYFNFLNTLFSSETRFISLSDNIDSNEDVMNFVMRSFNAVENSKKLLRKNKLLLSFLHSRSKGVHIGRPKKANDSKVRELRAQGLSLNQISEKMKISKGAVQYSLRHASK